MEDSLTAPRPAPGPRAEAWTIATEDTQLTVGATSTGQLCIYELSHPAAGWNWTAEPSVFALLGKAEAGGAVQDLRWKFKDGTLDKADGQKVTIRFVCDNPPLELQAAWWARPGRGPIHHSIQIANRSDKALTLFEQPTIHLDLAGPGGDGALAMWTFHSDGGTPDKTGVYRNAVEPPFYREIRTHPGGEFIPYAVFDAGGKHGVYIGIEWSYCRIAAAAAEGQKAGAVRVRGGEFDGFKISVGPGETFETPPGFLGAYNGDVDDAGNSLRRYLFNYNMPEVVRKDASYPKVQWNAFGASGDKPGSWNSVEAKYYPLVNDIAPLGFEEVMLDVGWWKGGTHAPEPEADPVDWPSGMAKAAQHAHQAGLRFGLYWNKGEEMASPEGRERRRAHIQRLYSEYNADMWRSDGTGGPVVGASYASVKGFYAMLEQLSREILNFQWENCNGGGRIKDFGAMQHSVKIFVTDTYAEYHIRQAFYDSSFAFPAAQIEGCVGSTNGRFRPQGPAGMKFAFRSTSLGAPEWFIDAPNGGNGSAPWTDAEKAAVKAAVATYKARIRPLVRSADLYHILPRPDGKNWDGIQYYDPSTKKGVVYLFKPAAGTDTLSLKLRGVEPKTVYRVTFEDGSNPAIEKSGEELAKGLEVTLKGEGVSELVFLEASTHSTMSSERKPMSTMREGSEKLVTIKDRDPRIMGVDGVREGKWGGAMWCPFAGTSVKLVANTGPECGMADVYVDGIWQKTANWYSERPVNDVTVFAAQDLPDGKHLLGLLTRGAKQPESKGTAINWSRIEYTAGADPERFVPVRRTRFDPNVPLWLDNQGNPIQGHLGGILFHEGRYYWLGMDWRGEKLPGFPFDWGKNLGFAVYSSTDLMNWTYHGNSCGPVSDPKHPLHDYTRMVARVRPLRAAGSGKFVALFQLVGNPFGNVLRVEMNATAVAVAETPEGPYQWHGVLPCDGQPVQGADTAVFSDDDGKQYLITAHSGDNGWNVSEWLYELAPDCLRAVRAKNLGTGGEAPAIFKYDGVYYLLHSHLTALAPNENFYHTATNIWGPWQAKGKIAQGENSARTFMTQTMDVVPLAGKKGAFIWIGDSIRGHMRPHTRSVWLPVTLRNKGEMEIRWRDSWDLPVFGD